MYIISCCIICMVWCAGMTDIEIELAMSRSGTSASGQDALSPATDDSQAPPFAAGYFWLIFFTA